MNKLINTKNTEQDLNMSDTLYKRYLNIKSKQIKKETSDLIDESLDTNLQDTQWFLYNLGLTHLLWLNYVKNSQVFHPYRLKDLFLLKTEYQLIVLLIIANLYRLN